MTDARDYSATLFLPQTDFPMRAGLPQKEPEILARWAKLSGPRTGSYAEVDLTIADGKVHLVDDYRDESSTCRAIAGEYPNASKLIDAVPDEGETDAEIAVNPTYFAQLLDAAAKFGDDLRPLRVVRFHPLRSCLFTVDDVDGKLDLLIMPVRML